MKHTNKGTTLTEIILAIFKLNGLLVSDGDKLVKELGLTSARWKVLGALNNNPQAMTVPDIARAMGQSRQAVQRLANEMLDDDLLESQINPEHQRAKLFKLTKRGEKAYRQAMLKQTPWVNNIASEASENDLKKTLVVLEKLITKLET